MFNLLLYSIHPIPDLTGAIMKFTNMAQCGLWLFMVGVFIYIVWKAYSR